MRGCPSTTRPKRTVRVYWWQGKLFPRRYGRQTIDISRYVSARLRLPGNLAERKVNRKILSTDSSTNRPTRTLRNTTISCETRPRVFGRENTRAELTTDLRGRCFDSARARSADPFSFITTGDTTDPYFAIRINLTCFTPDRCFCHDRRPATGALNWRKLNRTASITHLFPSRPTICRSFRNRPVARAHARCFFARRVGRRFHSRILLEIHK